MSSGYKVGDVVTLNSGGPKMTVVKVNPAIAAANTSPPTLAKEETLECWWFDAIEDYASVLGKAEFPSAAFPPKKEEPKE